MSYHRPKSVAQALEILDQEGKSLKPIAGCTDISVAKEEKVLDRHSYLDLSFVDELKYIIEKDGFIHLGPLVTHGDIAASDLIKSRAPVLAEACSTVGSPQIRNRGTVGGNICHASPSGDSIPALYVLNAEFHLESKGGGRWAPAVEFFTGPGKTIRTDGEIVTGIRFRPLSKSYRSKFFKLGQRKSLSCSKVSLAFCANIMDGKTSDVRIAMGAVAPTVIRAPRTEKYLEGKKIHKEVIEESSRMICQEARPISDVRSTGKYRKKMVGVLLEKVLSSL